MNGFSVGLELTFLNVFLVFTFDASFERVEGILMYFCLAVSLLKGLKHANIVTLHDIVALPKSITLIFEYVVSIPTFRSFYCTV